jgi:hypothetical protein
MARSSLYIDSAAISCRRFEVSCTACSTRVQEGQSTKQLGASYRFGAQSESQNDGCRSAMNRMISREF